MKRVRTSEAILFLLLASLSRPAAADPDRTTVAKQAFERATRHYNLGEFEQALTHFKEAYAAKPLPALLFNIAQCHRNSGRPRDAIFFFERYLEEQPNAPEAAEIERLLEDLRDQIERQRPAAPPPPPASAPPATPPPAIDGTNSLEVIPPKVPEVETTSVVEKWWFWTALIAGAAAIAGGTALAVRAADGNDLPEDPIATFDHRRL
jgi:tetratricopeptide (TPR) repeat protein